MSGNRVGFFRVRMLLLTPCWLLWAGPAQAAVYCAHPGYPIGCVARPVAGLGVGARGVGVTARGPAGVGGVGSAGAGAPGAGVAPANRGGPVNRAGAR